MTKEEEISRNLTLIEYYKEQLNSVDMQAQFMQAAVADYQKAKLTVSQMKKYTKDSEILIPIGGGNFLNGSLTDVSKVLVDIGAGFMVEKSVDEAVKKIEERLQKVQGNQEQLVKIAQKLQKEANELSQKTQTLMEEGKQ
jgi:prefoldin alpha subunit